MADAASDSLQHFTMRYPYAEDAEGDDEIRSLPRNLCHRCCSISLRQGSTTPHHSSISELEASAKKGCLLCDTFIVQRTIKWELPSGSMASGITTNRMGSCEYSLSLILPGREPPDTVSSPSTGSQTWIESIVYLSSIEESHDGSRVFPPSVGVGPPLHSPAPTVYGSTRDALRQARVWLDTCILSHSGCNEPCVEYVPTRLISTTEGATRLCLGKEIAQVKRYATLSHCWVHLDRYMERHLAPRSLHFTKNEVVWECRRGTTFERFPSVLPNILRREWDLRKDTAPTWKMVVKNYSGTSLTYPTDRLVALSGIARQMQMKTNYHYIAGMWRESLGMDLCWVLKSDTSTDEDAAYVAPTWSWASTSGPVELDALEDFVSEQDLATKMDYLMSVVGVDIKLRGSDPFGQLISATLRLECSSLLHATASLLERTHSVGLLTVANHQLDCMINMSEDRDLRPETDSQDEDSYGKPFKTVFDVYAMIVKSNEAAECRAGILLRLVPEHKGTYKRIGCFWMINGLKREHSPASFEKISKECHGKLESGAYVSQRLDESGQIHYTIDII
ncbi:heterokaryon incompatibility protein [Stemphylium lycopersici]|nr:heterokaryon incompatibility protein [Stemphylium lycopersici]